MASVLESIYEPIFLPVSFGFRKWSSTHLLFQEIKSWQGIKRVVHADVLRCFDTVRHKLVLDLLSEQIDDPFFLDLVHRFLTTPIETANGTDFTNTEVGIVQGVVLSPALMNIIIHPLDLFATELCKRGGTYYGHYCNDISIGTKGNNDAAAH
jgi:RNA-directed DNA polymerase